MTLILNTKNYILSDTICGNGSYTSSELKVEAISGAFVSLAGNYSAMTALLRACNEICYPPDRKTFEKVIFSAEYASHPMYSEWAEMKTSIKLLHSGGCDEYQIQEKGVNCYVGNHNPCGNGKFIINYLRPIIEAFSRQEATKTLCLEIIFHGLGDWLLSENSADPSKLCGHKVRFTDGEFKVEELNAIEFVEAVYDWMIEMDVHDVTSRYSTRVDCLRLTDNALHKYMENK